MRPAVAASALEELSRVRNIAGANKWMDTELPLPKVAAAAQDGTPSLLRAQAAWSEPWEADNQTYLPAQDWASLWKAALVGDYERVALAVAEAEMTWLRAPDPTSEAPLAPPCPRCSGTEWAERGAEDQLWSKGRSAGTKSRVLVFGALFSAVTRPLVCTRCGVGVFGRTGHPLLIPSGGLDFVGLDVIAYTSYLCMSMRTNVQAASKAALFSAVKPLATRGFNPFPSYHMIKNARERFAQLVQPHVIHRAEADAEAQEPLSASEASGSATGQERGAPPPPAPLKRMVRSHTVDTPSPAVGCATCSRSGGPKVLVVDGGAYFPVALRFLPPKMPKVRQRRKPPSLPPTVPGR